MAEGGSLWLKRNGVRWDGLRIEDSTGSLRGTCVRTEQARQKEELLAAIPKSTVLSVRTASCASLLSEMMQHGLEPSAALNFAVAYESAMGTASKWYGYFRSIPPFEPLPLVWESSELSWLSGTGLDEQAKRRRKELRDEHAEICQALVVMQASDAMVDATQYLHAATLTSSRAFFVDEWHGEALVPFADLLNHKCALIPDGADVEGLSDEEDGEERERGESAEEDEEVEEDGHRDSTGRVDAKRREAAQQAAPKLGMDLRMDTTLHNVEDRLEEEEKEEDSAQEEAEEEEDGEEGERGRQVRGHVALIALRDLEEGAEVFNTYGELDNRALLSSYGFTLAPNPLDIALLPWPSLHAALCALLSPRYVRARHAALRSSPCAARFRKLLRAPHHFDYNGRPPAPLLLLLWMLLADPAAAPWWMLPASVAGAEGQGEDEADGGCAAMEAFLQSALADQLRAPSPLLVPTSKALLAAIQTQQRALRGPLRQARAHASVPLDESARQAASPRAERAARACAVLEGDLRIWEQAERMLAATPAVASKKRRRDPGR